MESLLRDGERSYRIIERFQGAALTGFYEGLRKRMVEQRPYIQQRSVSAVHQFFRQGSRLGAAAHKLLVQRHSSVPYKTFACLADPSLINDLFAAPKCMLDPFTEQLLHGAGMFCTKEAFQAPAAQALLHSIAMEAEVDTVSTERVHAANLRKAKGNTHTHNIALSQLAAHLALRSSLHHSLKSWVARSEQTRVPEQKTQHQGNAQLPFKKQKISRVGPWKAFLSAKCSLPTVRASSSFEVDMTALAAEYRALSAREHDHYKTLGMAMTAAKETKKRTRSVESARQRWDATRQMQKASALASGGEMAVLPGHDSTNLVQECVALAKQARMWAAEDLLDSHKYSTMLSIKNLLFLTLFASELDKKG